MEPSIDPSPASLPLGRSGRLEAMALSAAGDHAVLLRETGSEARGRALVTTDKLPTGERLVVMPLDDEVDVRVDGDALAVWLGAGSLAQLAPEQQPMPATGVPIWASVIGGGLLLLVLAFAVIGSAVAFAWLTALLT
ncbi:MAG TPA: hypothetical protein VFN76_03825 [Candidatus Limnocylindria bacterium]|nr:hypothetical protein [Candidatus Limnocylindria bacterium]